MSPRNSAPLRPQQVRLLTGRSLAQIARTGTRKEKADVALALHMGEARVVRLRPEDARRLAGASYSAYYKARRIAAVAALIAAE
jgi:hypothetical protein